MGRTIGCNVFASQRQSSLGSMQASYEWIGDNRWAPPVLEPGDVVEFLVHAHFPTADPETLRRYAFQELDTAYTVLLTTSLSDLGGGPGQLPIGPEPSRQVGWGAGDVFSFSFVVGRVPPAPNFHVRITLTATPRGAAEPVTYTVDPEMVVGAGERPV